MFGGSVLMIHFFIWEHDEELLKEFIMRLIHFIQLSNLQQTGQKKKLIF